MNTTLIKNITINNKIYILSLEYILGLFEGDGSIYIQLKPNSTHKTGKQVILNWDIHQHAVDKDLLQAISIYLGCGKVEIGRKVGNPDTWVYRFRISNQKDIINILLPILKSDSMLLNKREHDKNLFLEVCNLIQNKEHITIEGQEKIINITSNLSHKLNLENKLMLSDTPNVNLNKHRITGFTDAEGNFSFNLYSKKEDSNKTYVNFTFSITQENTEIKFLTNLVTFFNCGQVYTGNEGQGRYYVSNRNDIINKIIPFFESNKLQTIKQYSFLKFKKALEICTNNKPLLQNNIDELNLLLSDKTNSRPIK